MSARRPIFSLAIGLIVGSFVLPLPATSQCMVMTTNVTFPGPSTTLVEKYLSMSYSCASIPTQMNALVCNPGNPGYSTTLLTAERMVGTTMAQCVWTCVGCGTVTIDGTDGLPVELMDFSVEGNPPNTEVRVEEEKAPKS